jgi:hypothetical protein
MLQGMKEPYRKGGSESILAPSLAGGIARWQSKRRQRYQWAGLLSFEKPMVQDVDSMKEGGNTTATLIASGMFGPA